MDKLKALSLPPGFGFHPTDVELISHYLKRKLLGQKFDFDLIPELDIYKHEPWDLSSKCTGPQSDTKWYFFTPKDRKYPTGPRSNRATKAGYWKSTGKDRNIKQNNKVIGTKKTLVFHQGRPPAGKRTEWIMHEYYLDESECKDAPDAKDLFVLSRVTKRDGCLTDADMPAPAEVVPNELEQSSGVVDPAVHDNLLSPSGNIVISSNSNHNNNNGHPEDIENWLQELFAPNEPSLMGQQFSAVPLGSTPCAPKLEPKDSPLSEGSSDENSFLLADDIQSILGTHDHENTQNLQFLEDRTTGPDSAFYCDIVGYNNGDDETGIVIRQRSTTTSYDNPYDTDGSIINKYNLKSKLQMHLYKKEEKSLETVSFTPKDGLVGEFENSEKIKAINGQELQSTVPKRAKKRGFLGMGTLIFSALLVAGIATLFCSVLNNSGIFS